MAARYTVQTGVPTDQIIATLSLFRRYLLMLAPLLLFAAASGGYWLSRKALSPGRCNHADCEKHQRQQL